MGSEVLPLAISKNENKIRLFASTMDMSKNGHKVCDWLTMTSSMKLLVLGSLKNGAKTCHKRTHSVCKSCTATRAASVPPFQASRGWVWHFC